MRERDLFSGYGIPGDNLASEDGEVSEYLRFLRLLRRIDGHWLWSGPMTRDGQTLFVVDGRRMSAKRYSFESANDTVVAHPMVVMVTCEHRTCVFPDHLAMVTRDERLARQRERPLTYREVEFRARRARAIATALPQFEVRLSTKRGGL